MASSSAEAAMPSTASARLSQARSGSDTRRVYLLLGRLLAGLPLVGADFLDLGAKLGKRRLGVDALGACLLDPVVDDRRGPLAHLGGEGRVGAHDLGVRFLQRIEAFLVGRVPRLPIAARGILVRVL